MPIDFRSPQVRTTPLQLPVIIEPDETQQGQDWWRYLVDAIIIVTGLALAWTGAGGFVAGAALAATDTAINAGIDIAQGKDALTIGLDFLPVVTEGFGKVIELGLKQFKSIAKYLDNIAALYWSGKLTIDEKLNYIPIRVLTLEAKRKGGKITYDSFLKLVKSNIKFEQEYKVGTLISNNFKQIERDLRRGIYVFSEINETEDDIRKSQIALKAARLAGDLAEVERLTRLLNILVGSLNKILPTYLKILRVVTKTIKDLSDPINTTINAVFKVFYKKLSQWGYFRWLRKQEQLLLERFVKSPVGKKWIDASRIALWKIHNLKPVDSDWIAGYRIYANHVNQNKLNKLNDTNKVMQQSDWFQGCNLEIYFVPSKTITTGARGAAASFFGKAPVVIHNISKALYDAWEASSSKGNFYYYNFAYGRAVDKKWDANEIANIINLAPGISIVLDPILRTKRLIESLRRFHFASPYSRLWTKIINKAARLLPTREIRFWVRTVTYATYRQSYDKLPDLLARHLSKKASRSWMATNTLGGDFRKYKRHKKAFGKIKQLRGF